MTRLCRKRSAPSRGRALAVARVVALALALTWVYPTLGRAQVENDSALVADSAKRVSERAREAVRLGTREGREHAIRLWTQAAALFAMAGDPGGRGAALREVGVIQSQLGQTDSALASFRTALELLRAGGDVAVELEVLGDIGSAFFFLGQPDSALIYFRQAQAGYRRTGDRSGEAGVLVGIGDVFEATGSPDSALAYSRQSVELRRELGELERAGGALSMIARIHNTRGELDSALAYYHQALAAHRGVGNQSGEAAVLVNIGLIYQNLPRFDSALAYMRQGLAIARAAGDVRGEAGARHGIATVQVLRGQMDSALTAFHETLAVVRAIGERYGESAILNNIAAIHYRASRLDSALAYLSQSLVLSRQLGDRRAQALKIGNIASIHRALGQLDSAVAYLGQALALAREMGARERERFWLYQHATFFHRDAAPPALHKAVAYYDSATAVVAAVGARTGGESQQVSYIEARRDLFDGWAAAWLARAPEAGAEAAALAGLAAVERGRAQALLGLLRRAPPDVRPGADLVGEGRRLADAAAQPGTAAVSYLAWADTLFTWLIEPSGAVSLARQPISRDTLGEWVAALRTALGVDDAAIGSRLWPGGGALERTPRPGAERGGLAAAAPLAQSLAELLVPPELAARLAGVDEVVVIPHGPLALVPFGALPLGRGAVVEPFGARFAVRYAPSLATLAEVEQRPVRLAVSRGKPGVGALSVGDPLMPSVETADGEVVPLAPLPHAGEEARWVAERLGGRFLGQEVATETRVRQSFVALAPDSVHDGLLTVGEVLDDPSITVQADLVVLSACQTGLGDLKQSEGTVGLQRAFLAKGARSVLVSLWNVSDAATDALMRAFYRHWLEDADGPSKAEALRRAQDDVRATPGLEHPRFWAGFQLVGAR